MGEPPCDLTAAVTVTEPQAPSAGPFKRPDAGRAPDATAVMSPRRPALVQLAIAIACLVCVIGVFSLDTEKRQVQPYFSWLAAMLLYVMQWPVPRGLLRWRPSRWLLVALMAWSLGLFLAFCAIYGNWRWAFAGDSLSFYAIGEGLFRGSGNPLSVHGVYDHYTVIQATWQNAFMFFSRSLFAHRLGNFVISALIVIVAAVFAAQTSSATAAVLLGLFLPVHSVFVTFTMVSFPNLEGLLPYYAVYALFVAAWRVWRSDFLWAALGIWCGIAVYFPPLWMGAVAAVSTGVVLSALYWRTPRVFLVWAGGLGVALLPGLLQLHGLLGIYIGFRPTEGQSLNYFLHIAAQTFTLPFASKLYGYGSSGPWMPPPFAYCFLAGTALAAASGVLALLGRRRGAALRHAWIWLLLYATDAAGLALQNSGYGDISLKRAIVLLPAMTFLTVLPIAWAAERVSRTWFTIALSVAALATYSYINATTVWTGGAFGDQQPRVSQGNIADAMVRVVQVAPGDKVLLVGRNPQLYRQFGAQRYDDDPMQTLYHVRDRTILTDVVPSRRSDFDRVVCYSRVSDGDELAAQVRAALALLCPGKDVEHITAEMDCFTCDPT